MSKTLKYLFTFSLLLVLLVSPTISEEASPAPDEPPSTGKIILEKDKAWLKTISTSKLIDKTGLSLTLKASQKKAPNMYVSKTAKAPTGDDSNWSLRNINGGSIFISSEELKGVEQVYVRFFCPKQRENCKAEFSVDVAKEVEISADGKPHTFEATEMGGISSMFVKIKVDLKDNANRLIVHADAVPIHKGLTPFMNLSIQKQNKDVKTKNTLVNEENIARSGWYAGKTVVIYKDNQVFCTKEDGTDCTYILDLKFLPQSQVRIQADLLPEKLEIKREASLDGVKKGAYNVYSYTFGKNSDESKNDLVIDLQAQEGSIKAYIDCDKAPENYKTFAQQYDIFDIDDRIVIPKEEHTDICISKGYTIVIVGLESSVYNIRASENQGHDLVLGEGTPVKGQIMKDQQIDYEVAFPFYMVGQLKIQLQTEGKVDISIHKCTTIADCPSIITKNYNPMFGSDSAYTPDQIKFETNEIEGGKEIILDALKNRCFPLVVQIPGMTNITEQRCVYRVSLKSSDTKIQDYSLVSSYTGNQILYVGKPVTGRVAVGESALYQIFIPYRKLESLTFQLSTLSGKAEIFVSKKSTHPLKSEDATFVHEDSVVFKDKEEGYYLGLFWITIRGVSTSTFTLTATAISSEGDPIDYATELTAGVPHKGVIDMKKQELTHFYRFKLDLPDEWKGIVKIVSTTLHGSIYLGVNNNDEVPTTEKDNFRSTNKNGLEISSDHELFLNKATYFIGVFPDLADPHSENLKEITYSITYFLITPSASAPSIGSNKEHIILTSASSYRDSLDKNRVLYFKIPILEGDQNLFITKQDNTQDLDLYLSTDPETRHPSPKDFTKSTKKSGTDYIELTPSDLLKVRQDCPQYQCFVYLSASTTSENQVPFTLSLEKTLAKPMDIIIPTILTEGEERTMKFPRPGQFVYFAFYPLPGKETDIEIFCPEKNINIYANVQKAIDGEKSKTDFKFPTANVYDFTSIQDENQLNTGAGHLRIPKSETLHSTVVTIMLTFEDRFSYGAPPGEPSSFSIVAASEIRHIHSGIPYYGSILKGDYHYFMIDVPLDDCKLIVSLEGLDDGDTDLLVSLGKDERPTKENHTFYSSSSVRSEIIEIDKVAIYPKKSMEGQWVFGVYGITNGRYSLTVVYQHKKIIQLYPGVSTEWYSKSDSQFYFTYYHGKHEDINLRVDKQSGYLKVYIKTLEPSVSLSDNLPSESSYTWTIDTDETHSIKINKTDTKYCFNCLYVILIEIEQGSKFSVLAHKESDVPAIKNSFRYSEQLEPGKFKRYQIAFPNADKIYLNTHVLSGSVKVYVMNNPIVDKNHSTWTDALSPSKPVNVLELDKKKADENNKNKYEMSEDEWVFSQRDFFYFYFINEGTETTEFKFSVYSKESTVVLPPNGSQQFLFDDDEERAFLFYSPHNGGTISLVMNFCVPSDVVPADDNKEEEENDGFVNVKGDMKIEELLAFLVDIAAFSEKTTVGKGKKIVPDAGFNEVSTKTGKIENNLYYDCAEQKIEWADRPEEGRYEIILSSPYEKPVLVDIRVDSSKSRYKHIDTNSEHSELIPGGDSKEFEVSLPGPGYWYFDLIACEGDVSVKYGENSKALPTRLGNEVAEKEFFIKEKIEKAERKYFKIDVEGDDLGKGANLFITSAYYPDDKSLLNYETTGDATNELELVYDYDYKGDDSVLEIGFRVPALKGFDKKDTNTFEIRFCLKEYVTDSDNICAALDTNKNQRCDHSIISGEIEKAGMITKTFEGVFPGDYQLSILRKVEHKRHVVRSFVMRNVDIKLKEPFLDRIWNFTLVLFSGILLILVIYFVYTKVKSGKVDQDVSIRKSPKKKGYGFVGEDEEDGEDNNLRKDN